MEKWERVAHPSGCRDERRATEQTHRRWGGGEGRKGKTLILCLCFDSLIASSCFYATRFQCHFIAVSFHSFIVCC